MTITGTSHFVGYAEAASYYRDVEGVDGYATIREKLAAGEIHVGKPELKSGERLVLLDRGRRYGIEHA